MHWIVQENLFHETGLEDLVSTLSRAGIPHSMHKVVPFVGEIIPDVSPTGKVFCIGSYSLRHLAKKKGWSPGVVMMDDHQFDAQLPIWGEHILNHDARVVKFKDVLEKLDPRREYFIRPVADSKVFAGSIYAYEGMEKWHESVVALGEDYGTSLTGETLIQYSSPKTIYSEFRTWVVGRKIVTSSQYRLGSRVIYDPSVPEMILEFARERISEFCPERAFVLDLALTPDGPKVVEMQCLNASGFYAGDVQKIVMSIEDEYGED